jgi:acyl dehydratase
MSAALQVGDMLPPLTVGPITRLTLALYCGASADHNPVHVDSDYARSQGRDDVFAHGMLSAAYLGRLLTQWRPQQALLAFTTRFVAVTKVHDVLSCSGRITAIETVNGVCIAELALEVRNQQGVLKCSGEARVRIDDDSLPRVRGRVGERAPD